MVSIIVPVYNSEKFLIKCLDSLKNQTYKNIEVIIINDGSTDRSRQICEDYCKENHRFKIINKENGGVSSARNTGIKISQGDYLCFVDPDDWIDKDMVENLIDLCEKHNADLSIGGYIKEKNNEILNNIKDREIKTYSNYEALNEILSNDGFKGFLCNKMFTKKVLKENNELLLNENIHFCEDLLFCCEYILKCEKIVYDNKPYYHYLIHDTNACNTNYSLKKITSLDALEQIVEILYNEENIQINKFKNYYMNMNISLLMNSIKENESDKLIYKKLKNNLYKYKIKDLNSNSVKIACLLGRVNPKLCYLIWKNIM